MTLALLVAAIGGYAFLSLTASFQTYYDATVEVSASGAINAGDGLVLNVTSLSWGVISPDESVTRSIRVSNILNVPATLFLQTSGWDPENATAYMGVSWNDDGTPLLGTAYRDVTLTLDVYANITGIQNFSFNITIGGTWT